MMYANFVVDDDLKNELRHIDRSLVNKATLKALKTIAKPVLSTVKEYAPVDTTLLRNSMTMTGFINNKDNNVAVVHVGLSKKNHPHWLISRGLAMEYGNDLVLAQPFLSRAAKRHRTPVYRTFRDFLAGHLDTLL